MSRAAYYKWKKTAELREAHQEKDANLKEHILAIHRLRPAYGYKRMRTALRKEGFPINHKKVRRLMRALGIQSVIRNKRPFAGRKPSVLFPNVINQKFAAHALQQKLVTDITFIRTGHEFVYLSAGMDLYNNEIIGLENFCP